MRKISEARSSRSELVEEEPAGFREKCAQCLRGPKQIIRSIVLLTCTIVVFYQIAECLRKIRNPPTTTYTHFDFNDTIQYPAVTICRDPPYKQEVLDKHGLYGHPRFTSEWKYFPFAKVDLDEFWHAATYDDEENIISIGLNTTSDSTVIKNTLHFIYGKCQTIYPTIELTTANKETGYSILLSHSMTDIKNSSSTIPPGYHVFIHQEEEPFAEKTTTNQMEYIYVNVGEHVDVKLEVQQVNMLSRGPEVCDSNEGYSSSVCSEICRSKDVIEEIGCSGPWIESDVPRCSNYSDMKDLIVYYIQLVNAVNNECDCPRRCRSYLYRAYVVDRNSLTHWDALTSSWAFKTGKERYQTQLYIYFNTKTVSVYQETHGYDWSLFLADFGGSLGFLLGLSVLGVISILENVFKTFIQPLVPKKKLTALAEEILEKDRKGVKRGKVPRNGGDGDSIKDLDEQKKLDRQNILNNYDTFDKYGDKHFYI